jgi:SNF2 family DNA or RNA helicase
MWINVYTTECSTGDSEYKTQNNSIYKLVRIEQNYNGNSIYIFKYNNISNGTSNDPSNETFYFYTELDSNNYLKSIINEYYNTSELIDINFLYSRPHVMKIEVLINTDMISIYRESMILKTICHLYIQSSKFNKLMSIGISTKLQKSSFLPNISIPYDDKKFKNFSIKLFDYQKKSIQKMSMIENGTHDFKVQRTVDIEMGDSNIIWDSFYNRIVDSHKDCTILTKGGILADSMGLGKTLTMVGLCHYNKITTPTIESNTMIYSNATLVIVPSHLAKQWETEYVRSMPKNMKIITILTKTQHVKLTYNDFKNADMIVVSQQFLLNFKYYIEINYKKSTPASYNSAQRTTMLAQTFLNWKETNMDIGSMIQPLFEHFHFNRVIVDEGHEIFEKNLGSPSLNKWLLTFLVDLKSSYKWYVSGTPFSYGFIECMTYLDFKIKLEEDEVLELRNIRGRGCDITHNKLSPYFKTEVGLILTSEEFIDRLLKCIVIRHSKDDVESMVKIPGYKETLEWVELTESERAIYNSKKLSSSKLTLQQLCCHPLIVDSMKKIIGNNGVIDLEKAQADLIIHHKSQITLYTAKIETIDKSNQAYHMLLSNFKSKISESTFMLNILEKINEKIETSDEITCVICFNDLNIESNTVLTSCGHLYCEDCIMTAIKYKSECPTCKNALDKNDAKLYRIETKKKKEISTDTTNPFIAKYGGKLGKLIQMIRHLIISSKTNRIIVFSQWDDMLYLIGKSLSENGVANSFIKGNVHCRNKAIDLFRKDSMKDDSRVIMLSLKNSASGTNLTEATHIFFVEPIDLNHDERKMIEGQAIGRACRLGQKNIVEVIRILCKDTIEEEIYQKTKNIVL